MEDEMTIEFRYTNKNVLPLLKHSKLKDCSHKGMHHPSECGVEVISRLALEGGNVLHKQLLFRRLKSA